MRYREILKWSVVLEKCKEVMSEALLALKRNIYSLSESRSAVAMCPYHDVASEKYNWLLTT